MSWLLGSVSTFSAGLGPLFLLPFGRPLGRFGVGGPTGSCRERSTMETITNQWKTFICMFSTSRRQRHIVVKPFFLIRYLNWCALRVFQIHLLKSDTPPAAVSLADPCPCAEAQEVTGRCSAGETALWSHCDSCLCLSTCVKVFGHQKPGGAALRA